MNREDIIRMAREAGFDVESDEFFNYKPQLVFTGIEADLQRFADLVAAAEREACAQLAEACDDKSIALFIRARGNT
jgi:hypothetical protein